MKRNEFIYPLVGILLILYFFVATALGNQMYGEYNDWNFCRQSAFVAANLAYLLFAGYFGSKLGKVKGPLFAVIITSIIAAVLVFMIGFWLNGNPLWQSLLAFTDHIDRSTRHSYAGAESAQVMISFAAVVVFFTAVFATRDLTLYPDEPDECEEEREDYSI